MIATDTQSTERKIRHYTLFVSIGLFIISLALNCFTTDRYNDGNNRGITLLVGGALGILGGESSAWYCWLANPLLIVAWVKFGTKPRTSLILSSIAVLFCFKFLTVDQILADESGGNFNNITGYKIGYWLWLASAFVMLIGCIYVILTAKRASLRSSETSA